MKMSPDEVAKALRWHANDPAGEAAAVKLRAHIAALEKERDAALADNAALRTEMSDVARGLRRSEHRHAMAERLERMARHDPHPGAALLEEHRRALVRSRNEGLEEALQEVATVAAKPFPDSEAKMLLDYAQDRIRAMKQPE